MDTTPFLLFSVPILIALGVLAVGIFGRQSTLGAYIIPRINKKYVNVLFSGAFSDPEIQPAIYNQLEDLHILHENDNIWLLFPDGTAKCRTSPSFSGKWSFIDGSLPITK